MLNVSPTAVQRIITGSALALLSAPTFAHPGHDEPGHAASDPSHAFGGSGDSLTLAVLVIVAALMGAVAMRWVQSREGRNK